MRVLTFDDGFTSNNAPTQGSIQQNSLASYANAAAFVTAKGSAAANGDAYYDTTDHVEKLYRNGGWTDVVTKDHAQVLTAKDIDGGTATDTSRLTLPKAATAALTALTRKVATLLYDSTTHEVKADDGSLLSAILPVGSVIDWPHDSLPAGRWLFLRGQAVSRTTYANLFALWGTRFGSGDGSTTFNVQDRRALFARGAWTDAAATVSNRSTNDVTATAHGFNRSGIPVRVSSITNLTGVTTGVTYYVIYVDANTIAFAATEADALAGTKIALGGTSVAATVTQYLDPDAATRTAPAPGGATGLSVGSVQGEQVLSHTHDSGKVMAGATLSAANDAYALISKTNGSGTSATEPAVAAYGGNETRPKNYTTNFIVKY